MKRMVPLLGSVFLVPSLSCVPPPENSGDCPLDDFQRGLIAEVITELLEDALWVTEMTHDLEQGSSLSLIGVNQAYRTTAFLVGECTEPQEFDPFCETAALPPTEEQEPFWQTRDRCGQLACESAGIRLSTVYMTMWPRTNPDDRHVFTYATDDPPGNAAYDPNPFITWRVDETEPDTVLFDSSFEFHLTVTPTGNEAIELGYQGRYQAAKENDEIVELSLTVSFPSLLDGREVRGLLTLGDPDQIAGTISVDDEEVATFTRDPGTQPGFVWSKACGGRTHP